jgi:hypothetical protein
MMTVGVGKWVKTPIEASVLSAIRHKNNLGTLCMLPRNAQNALCFQAMYDLRSRELGDRQLDAESSLLEGPKTKYCREAGLTANAYIHSTLGAPTHL